MYGLDLGTSWLKIIIIMWQKWRKCTLEIRLYKTCFSSLSLFSLSTFSFLSLSVSVSALLCCLSAPTHHPLANNHIVSSPIKRSHVARNCCLYPATHKELSSVNSLKSELGRSPTVQLWDDYSPRWHLDYNLERHPESEDFDEMHQDSWPQETLQ